MKSAESDKFFAAAKGEKKGKSERTFSRVRADCCCASIDLDVACLAHALRSGARLETGLRSRPGLG